MAIFKTKTEETKTTEVSEKKSGKVGSMAYRILVRPVVTEKATHLADTGQYVFMVEMKANKLEVAKAIREVYGVTPISVNIVRMQGKLVSRGKVSGKRKDYKKAIVTLKKGQTISIYEGV